MNAGLLSFAAQVSAHQEFVERHGFNLNASLPTPTDSSSAARWRKPTQQGLRNREMVLHILGDGQVHDFGELQRSLPLSRAGLKWLLARLVEEQRIELAEKPRSGRYNHYRLV